MALGPSLLPASTRPLLAQATRHETPCGDGTVLWHSWGTASATPGRAPLVLFHGGSGSWTHWVRNIEPMVAAGRAVWLPDLPGFGDSAAPPGGEDADVIPAPLAQGMHQLFGDKAVDLVGFSFGGMVAGLLAAAHPQRVRQLVLVGAPGLGVVPGRLTEMRGWRHLTDPAQRDAMHRNNLAVLMLHDKSAIDDETLAIHRTNVERDRLQRRRLAFTRALADALAVVQCPVDAIYGECDSLYVGRHQPLGDALAASTPRFRQLVWIAGAGHWVQYERAAEFNAALAKVLAS